MKLILELFISIILFVSVSFIYQHQPRISCNEGKGWDGVTYYGMATQFQQGATKVSGDVPFVKRLGTPFLIAKYAQFTGKDLLTSARDVNLGGSLLTLLLLVIWLRRFISKAWVRITLSLLYLLAWHGALRFLFYYPLISDIWGLVWLMSSLLLMDSLRARWVSTGKISPLLITALSLTIFIGILFRESNLVLALAALFIINPFSHFTPAKNFFELPQYLNFIRDSFKLYFSRKNLLLFLPLVFAVAASYISSKLIINTNVEGYSYLKTMLQWFYEKSVPEYLLAIFIAYGPLIVLLPFFYKSYKSILANRQDLTVLLLLALLFGYIGGTDTERIIYMSSFPIVFILLGISIQSIAQTAAKWWLIGLMLLQLLAYRVLWFIPDCATPTTHKPIPFFTLIGQDFEYVLLYSGFGNYALNSILFIQYALLLLLTGYIVNRESSIVNRQS